ncbi:MAG: right-handed parallel beta-helix repeat-containing protein [Elusimicrobia bacterium]|nr:right-handed parallel beta-helix repeat-containing protein [Elusimicrobiota bacterium]
MNAPRRLFLAGAFGLGLALSASLPAAAGPTIPLLSSATLSSGNNDQAEGIAKSGTSLYIVGYSSMGPQGRDIWVSKWNESNLTVVSSRTLNGSGGSHDEAQGVAVDGGSGNVFAVGYSSVSGFGNVLWLGKFDSAMNLISSATFGGIPTFTSSPKGILIDPGGNLYVSGDTPVGANNEILVAKFDSFLGFLSSATFFNGFNGNTAFAITRDAGGNIYVGGAVAPAPATSSDLWIGKFDSSLVYITSFTQAGPGGNSDIVFGVSVDPTNNFLFAAGVKSITGADSDLYVAKFDLNLNQLVTQTYTGPVNSFSHQAMALAVTGNRVYLGGQLVAGGTAADALISEMDYSLNVISSSTFDGGSSGNDQLSAVVVDTASEKAFGAGFVTTGPQQIFLAKYALPSVNPSGNCTAGYTFDVAQGPPPRGFGSIQAAVNALPKVMTGDLCVVIRDTNTYNEQVTIQGFTNNGFQVKIMADPSFVSSAPVVSPPSFSTAAFQVMNASVTISGFGIVPTVAVSYGVQASSPSVTISSLSVIDNLGKISPAGVFLSSYTKVFTSSVVVVGADAFYLEGTGNLIDRSSGTANWAGVRFNGGSGNTVDKTYLYSPVGSGMYFTNGTTGNIVKFSTITSNAAGPPNLYLDNLASSNTITQSYIANPLGVALQMYPNSSSTTVTLSTITSNSTSDAFSADGPNNVISQVFVSNSAGPALELPSNASYAMVSQSTITGNSATNAALAFTGGSSNTVTLSYISNALSTAAYLNPNSKNNTIIQSTMSGNSAAYALFLDGASSNTLTQSFLLNPLGPGVLLKNANANSISFSTINTGASGGLSTSLSFMGASSNTVTQSYFFNKNGGYGAYFTDSSSNTISFSTVAMDQGATWDLRMINSSSNTFAQSFFSNLSGYVALLDSNSNANTISQSTMTSNSGFDAVQLSGSSRTKIIQCYLFSGGSTALKLDEDHQSQVTQSSIVANSNGGVALWVLGSASATISQSFISNPVSTSAYVTDFAGTIFPVANAISSCTIKGNSTAYALWLKNAYSNSVTDSFISNPLGSAVAINAGANDTISRSTVTSGATGTFALFISGSSNTIDMSYVEGQGAISNFGSTGTVVDGSVLSGGLGATPGPGLQSNAAVGLSVTTTTLICGSSTGGVCVNLSAGANDGSLSFTSNTISGSGAANAMNIGAQSPGAILSISSLTFSSLAAGATAINFQGGTFNVTFSSVNFADTSIAVNVNASPLSGGSAVTMANAAGPRTGPSFANDPLGVIIWPGYVGAGLPGGCATGFNVKKSAGGDYSSISVALNHLPPSLAGGDACVVIRDTQTYTEQVNVAGVTNNGFFVRILADPSFISSAPVVSPPAFSTAAFLIANASVTIGHIAISPANSMSYGIKASSGYVTISSVSLLDPSGKITEVGVSISSYSFIGYSTISVQSAGFGGVDLTAGAVYDTVTFSSITSNGGAALSVSAAYSTISQSYVANPSNDALVMGGGGNAISQSSVTSNGAAKFALAIVGGASFNTVTLSYLSSPNGNGLGLLNVSNNNTISQSSITSAGVGGYAVDIYGSTNTLTSLYIYEPSGYGAYFQPPAANNMISQSRITNNSAGYPALYLTGSSYNTITQSFISNTADVAVSLSGDSHDTIRQSTVTSNGGPGQAISISGSSDTIDASYVQGQQAISNFGSTGTVIDGSVLFATGTFQKAIFSFASVGLTVTTNTIFGGPQGAGVFLDIGHAGPLSLTSNTILGCQLGLKVNSQSAGAVLSVTSMTFLNLSAGATAINFLGGTFVSTFSKVFFDNSIAVNVNASLLTNSTITMTNFAGPQAGPQFSNDPFGEVVWAGLPVSPVTFPPNPFVMSLFTIKGTAQAFNGNTITAVQVTIQRLSDSFFWNGSAFVTGSPSFLPATFIGASSGTWSYSTGPDTPQLSAGVTYRVRAFPTDTVGVSGLGFASDFKAVTFAYTGNFAAAGGAVAASNNGFHDIGAGIAVDNSGPSIYEVVMSSTSSSFSPPMLESLVKLDGNGNYLQSIPLNGNQGDAVIAVGSGGTVFVADKSSNPVSGLSITLATYNSSLVQTASINLDTTVIGNVTAMGTFSTSLYTVNDGGSSENHAKVIKYDSALSAVSTATYVDGTVLNSDGNAIALDAAGNVYVAVSTSTNPGSELHLVKYTSGLTELWDSTITALTPNEPSIAVSTEAAGATKVYVACSDLTGGASLVSAYNGVFGNYTNASSTQADAVHNINASNQVVKVAPDGSVFLAYPKACDGATCPGKGDYGVVKYDRDLHFLLSSAFNGPANSTDTTVGLAVLDSSNVVVTGASKNGSGDFDAVSVKLFMAGGGAPIFVAGTDISPSTVATNGVNVPLLRLGVWTDGAASFNSVNVGLLGNAPSSNVGASLWQDNGDGLFKPSDTLLSTAPFGAGSPPLALLQSTYTIILGGTTQYFFVTVTFSSMSVGRQLGVTLPGPANIGLAQGGLSPSVAFPIQSGQPVVQQLVFANPAAQGAATPTANPGGTGGLDTGLQVQSGQNIFVTATGTWNTGGFGVTNATGIATLGGLDPALKIGSLVGRVGGGNWFQLGSSVTVTAGQTGDLFLAMNDTSYLDNAGSIAVGAQVFVSTTPRIWTGNSGVNSNASINANWLNSQPPASGETVLFDNSVSSKNCNWDIYSANVGLLKLTTSYTGTVTIAPAAYTLTVSSEVEVFNGVLTLGGAVTFASQNKLRIAGGAFDMGPGGGILQLGHNGISVLGGGGFRSVGASTATLQAINPNDPFPFTVTQGTINLNNSQLTYVTDSAGLQISSLTSVVNLSKVSFTNANFNPLPSIVFSGPTWPSPVSFAFSKVAFDNNVSTNVSAGFLAAGSTVTINDASGAKFGSPFDSDPNHVVFWSPDGGASGSITGTITNSGGGSGNYNIVAYTGPGLVPGPMSYVFGTNNGNPSSFLKAVAGGPGGAEGGSFGGQVNQPGTGYTISGLQAPNTYYIYAWRDPSGNPTGFSPRGAYGNGPTQGMVSNPVFLPAGGTVSAIDITINDWSAVSGTITMNSSQVGPISADVWVGAPNVAGSTLAAAFDFPSLPQGGATFYTMPAPPTTVQSDAYIVLSTANFSAFQSFEASGSSGPTAAVANSAATGGLLNITGGSSAPGGTLTVATVNPFTFHQGYVGYTSTMAASSLPQAMLRLDVAVSGSSLTLNALRVDLSTPAPQNGLYLTLWWDSNLSPGGDGLFQNPFVGGAGTFDGQLNAPVTYVPPGVSSGVIILGPNPHTVLSGTSETYFVAVDLKGQTMPDFQMSIASTSYFTLSQGSAAAQGIYPIATSTASAKFATMAAVAAQQPSGGGVDTGFFVAGGQSVIVNALVGTWNVSAASSTGPGGIGGTAGQNTIVPAANQGQLVGRVGDSLGNGTTWYPVTGGVPFNSPASGRLFLAINDYSGAYFDDFGAVFSTFSVAGSTTGAISGTVFYLGTQTGNLFVRADQIQPCFTPTGSACPQSPHTIVSTVTLTLVGGTTYYGYTLGGLPAQFDYTVDAVVQNAPSQTGKPSSVSTSLVSGSTVTGVDFTMSLGSGSIAGSITYSGVQNVGQFLLAIFDNATDEFAGVISTPNPAAYIFTGLPTPATYYIFGFRDVNGDFEPNGPEPAGLAGDLTLSSLFVGSSNLIFLDTAASIAGQTIPLFDRGALAGDITFPSGSAAGDLVVQVGHGVPGTPGYSFEDQKVYSLSAAGPGSVFSYSVGLLTPATDYSVLAFVSTDLSDSLVPGNAFAQVNGPLAVSSAAVTQQALTISPAGPPLAVTGFAGVALSTIEVRWSWDTAIGATNYQLLNAVGTPLVSLSSSSLSFIDVVIASNTFSAIRKIKAQNNFGPGPIVLVSSVASFAAAAGTPTFPGVSQSSISLTWPANGNTPGTVYQILRATASGGPFSLIFSTGSSSATDSALLPATPYFYGIGAFNGNGIAAAVSSTGSVTTAAGFGPSISGSFTYTGTQKGLIAIQISTNASFSPVFDLARLPNSPYYFSEPGGTNYNVRAFVDVFGDGAFHSGEDVSPSSAPSVGLGAHPGVNFTLSADTVTPAIPVGLAANTPFGKIVLNWVAPNLNADGSTLLDLAGFRVQRSTNVAGPFVTISTGGVFGTTGTVAGNTYTDFTPFPGVVNYYRVAAVDFAGNQGFASGSIGVTPYLGATISGVVKDLASSSAGPMRVRLSATPDISSFLAETALSTYSFTGLADGIFYVEAFRDLNGDAKQQDGEPGGNLGGLGNPYPINIFGGNSVTGTTVTVCDHSPVVFGLGAPTVSTFTLSAAGCPALDQGGGFFTNLMSFRVGGGAANSLGTGSKIAIQMQSAYPNRLILLGPDGSVAATDNRPGGAYVSYTANQAGLYFIEPTSFNQFDVGPATVSLSVNGGFSGVISGAATYSGVQSGKLAIQLFNTTDPTAFPVVQSTFAAPGAYSVGGLPDGQYFVRAFRDANGNGSQDAGEPNGAFGVGASSLTAVQIQGGVRSVNGSTVAPVNLTMTDPAVGTVAGTIVRQGTQSGTIVVSVGFPPSCPTCGQFSVIAFATIPAAGAYSIPFVPPATTYMVLAFVDVNGNSQNDPLEARGAVSSVTVTANQTTTVGVFVADPGSGASGNSTISGTVSYGGSSTGPLLMAFAADSDFNFIPYVLSQASTGSFVKNGVVGGATYYVAAFLDNNNNSEPDDRMGEPIGFYGAIPANDFNSKQAVFVPASSQVVITVALLDAPTGQINGVVTYSGAAPINQNIVVKAFVPGVSGHFTSHQAGIARTPGVSDYGFGLPFLAAATYYTVASFIDANGNGNQDPGEPFGVFGQANCSGGGPCFGSPVNVSSGPNTFPTYGVNVQIVDPNTGGGNFNNGSVTGNIIYLGIQSGPFVIRLFSTSTYAGAPALSFSAPAAAGSGSFPFTVPNVPPGTYFVDAFRDTSGSGIFNPAFQAYEQFGSVILPPGSPSVNLSNSGQFMTDPGAGGSLNVYTGSFTAPGGARFDGGAADLGISVAADTTTAGGPFFYVTGLTDQRPLVLSIVKYSSGGVFLASTTVASIDGHDPIFDPSLRFLYIPGSVSNSGVGTSTAAILELGADLHVIRTIQLTAADATFGGEQVDGSAMSGGLLYAAVRAGQAGGSMLRQIDPNQNFKTISTGTFAFPGAACSSSLSCSGTRLAAIAVDTNTAYVYALATFDPGGPGKLAALLKYDSGLNLLASQDITNLGVPTGNGGGSGSLAVDGLGNLFLSFVPVGQSPPISLATYKFNSSNLQQLNYKTFGPILTHFGFGDLQVGPDGYVYETAESTVNGGDYIVLRYDPALNLAASRTFNGTAAGSLEDFPGGFYVLDSSRVYVTGAVNNGASLDWATVQFNMNASGAQSGSGTAVVITTANATNAVFGTLSYAGSLASSGTVRAFLFPLGGTTPTRFSSAPFAANSTYLFNNVPGGVYQIRAFIDPNSNFIAEAGEPVSVSSSTGFFFSGSSSTILNLDLCDRRPIAFGTSITDTITTADCRAQDQNGAFQRLYTFSGSRGQAVTIENDAVNFFDAPVRLYDSNGILISYDDGGAGNGNSRISAFQIPADGLYTIGVSPYAAGLPSATFKLTLGGSAGSLGSISGTVNYTGVQGGQILLGLFSTSTFLTGGVSPVSVISVPGSGPFNFTNLLTGTTYFLGGFVDVNANGRPDSGEDSAFFGSSVTGAAPIFLQSGQNASGIGFTIASSSAVVLAGISGVVSYAGTQTGQMHVEFWSNSLFSGQPVAARVVPTGPGPYDILVPAGVPYYVRAFLDTNNSGTFDAFNPAGLYAPRGQGAEAVFAPSSGSIVGVSFSMFDAGQSTAGIAGEGTATISPSTAAAGAAVFSATITYTGGANGLAVGGKLGFTVPPDFPPPAIAFITIKTTATATFTVSTSPVSMLASVNSGSVLLGQQVNMVYTEGPVACLASTQTFSVTEAQNAGVTPLALLQGSPSLQILPGPPAALQPSNRYLSITQGVISDAQNLLALDLCGNQAAVPAAMGTLSATLRAKRFDIATSTFVFDPTVGLSTGIAASTTSIASLSIAVGLSSATYYALSSSTGPKNIEVFYNFNQPTTFYYGLSVLASNALTGVSVSILSSGTGQTTAAISPNGTGGDDVAYINFTLGDPNQGWHVLVSSVPFKPGIAPTPVWESWGYGQPTLGQIGWDGRYSPWINGGARVASGIYYVRVELGNSGVHNDGLIVTVTVPQLIGHFFDGGVTPNPPLPGANVQIFGPNGTILTQSDAGGAYVLPGIQAGTYNMFVSRSDFLDGSLSVTVNAAGTVSTFTALTASVAGSINASGGLDVSMSRAAILLVTPPLSVSYSTQSAEQSGSLEVRTSTSIAAILQQTFFSPLHLAASSATFDDGGQWDTSSQQFIVHTVFKFTVAPGTYTVSALLPSFSVSSATVYVAQGVNSLTLPPLTRKSTVSGLVSIAAGLNPNGTFVSVNAVPLSSAAAAAGGGGGVFLAGGAGVTSGAYTVPNLDPGLYILRANSNGLLALSSGPIAVPVSSDVTNVDFPALAVGSSISGTITFSANTTGESLQVSVNAWSPGSLNFGSTNVYTAGGASGLTIPYSIGGLSAGATYQVYVNVGGDSNKLEVLGSQPLVTAAPNAAANFTFFASSGVISGTIILPTGSKDFGNVSLVGQVVASIHPEDVGRQFSVLTSTNLPGFTCVPSLTGPPASGVCPGVGDSTATFSVQGVNTETDDLSFFYATTGQIKKVRISAVNGSTTTVYIDLSPQTFKVSGSINNQITNALFNTNPNIVANAPFVAPPGYPAGISSTTARVVAVKQDITNFTVAISTVFNPATSQVGFLTAAGTFTITNLPSGVYFVRTVGLRSCATCAVLVPSVGQLVNVAGADVPVSSVTLTLSDGFSVAGTISLDGGLQDARIFNLTVTNQRQEVVASTTAYLGDITLGLVANSVDYSFSNLPAGNFYTLSVVGTIIPIKYVGKPIKFPNPGLSPNGLQSNLVSQNVTMQRAAYITGRMQDANTGELITANNANYLAPNFSITATANPWVEGGFAQAASSVAARPVQADGTFLVGPLLPNITFDLKLAQLTWDPSFLANGSQNYAPVTIASLRPQPGQIMDVGVISLNQGQSLSGTVFASTTTGAKLGNILVTALPSFGDKSVVVQTYTNQNGKYTLWVSTFISNEYDVTAAPRGGNLASNGVIYGQVILRQVNLLATTTADFILNPLLVTVTGQIVVADAATGGALSFPFGAQKGFPAAAVFMQSTGTVQTENPLGDILENTDSQGFFTVPGLSTGTFSLKAVSLGYQVFNATVTASTSSYVMYTGVNTPANYIPGNVITLQRGATVTGRIVKSDGSAPNSTEVSGVAAANFALGEYVIGSVDVDPVAKTVNAYTISGFKTGISYDLVILPADTHDDTVFPPEGSGVSFSAQESSTTKSINLTFGASVMECVATSKGLGNSQFQIKVDCNEDLRNKVDGDSDLSKILTISAVTSAGVPLTGASGTGQLLGSDKKISANRREITAIYRAAVGEATFSLRLQATASAVDPKTGLNFTIDKVFDFFAGLPSQVTQRISNIHGGSIQLQPSSQDELLGNTTTTISVGDERSRLDLLPGSFTFCTDASCTGSGVASATTTVTVGIAKAQDQASATALALATLGYVPSSLAILGNPNAFPADLAAAMSKYRTLASSNTVGGANPLSAFYSIFLPAGIRHQLKQRADLTFSWSTKLSTATSPDNINVYFFDATRGAFVLENSNRRLDPVNQTITVSVNHFSVFVVLDGLPVANARNPVNPPEILAVNFPNPSDCIVHMNFLRNAQLFGAGTFAPFEGPMVRFTLPGPTGEVHGASIRIYDLAGELVRNMSQGELAGGFTYYTPWNCTNASGRRVASGVYIGEVEWNGKRKQFKMAIIKGSGL